MPEVLPGKKGNQAEHRLYQQGGQDESDFVFSTTQDLDDGVGGCGSLRM